MKVGEIEAYGVHKDADYPDGRLLVLKTDDGRLIELQIPDEMREDLAEELMD